LKSSNGIRHYRDALFGGLVDGPPELHDAQAFLTAQIRLFVFENAINEVLRAPYESIFPFSGDVTEGVRLAVTVHDEWSNFHQSAGQPCDP
jgi:hypothetical protein